MGNDMKIWGAVIAAIALIVVMGITGCNRTTGPAGRPEALQAMKAAGFKFDDTIMVTQYGASQDEVIVTGPMIGPRTLGGPIPPKNGSTYARYARVVVKRSNRQWDIAAATLRDAANESSDEKKRGTE